MWSGLVSTLSVEALAGEVTGFISIPVVSTVILAVLAIALAIFAIRKLEGRSSRWIEPR